MVARFARPRWVSRVVVNADVRAYTRSPAEQALDSGADLWRSRGRREADVHDVDPAVHDAFDHGLGPDAVKVEQDLVVQEEPHQPDDRDGSHRREGAPEPHPGGD